MLTWLVIAVPLMLLLVMIWVNYRRGSTAQGPPWWRWAKPASAIRFSPNLVAPGVADASAHYLRTGDVADVYMWPWGRVVFVSR
jgi:hypothetical protein